MHPYFDRLDICRTWLDFVIRHGHQATVLLTVEIDSRTSKRTSKERGIRQRNHHTGTLKLQLNAEIYKFRLYCTRRIPRYVVDKIVGYGRLASLCLKEKARLFFLQRRCNFQNYSLQSDRQQISAVMIISQSHLQKMRVRVLDYPQSTSHAADPRRCRRIRW